MEMTLLPGAYLTSVLVLLEAELQFTNLNHANMHLFILAGN